MPRTCSRPGCADRASSTLAYEYRASTAWLDDLADDAHPSTYDLCHGHAGTLSVPKGWDLRDRRRGKATHLAAVAG
jgi:hypothetical protein